MPMKNKLSYKDLGDISKNKRIDGTHNQDILKKLEGNRYQIFYLTNFTKIQPFCNGNNPYTVIHFNSHLLKGEIKEEDIIKGDVWVKLPGAIGSNEIGFNDLFDLFNIWSVDGEAKELIEKAFTNERGEVEYAHTSMSVGDIIFDSTFNEYYLVTGVGFTKLI